MPGRFKIQRLSADGETELGSAAFLATEFGVRIFCHPQTDHAHIVRMCEMARDNPGELYDICAWGEGLPGERSLIWSARIQWING